MSVADDVKNLTCNHDELMKAKDYVKIVESWEKDGWINKPLTPMRDNRVIVPNKPSKPLTFCHEQRFF